MPVTPVQLGYFGKLPSRGDFVRHASQPALLELLDHWLSQAMDALASDAAWKQAFDAAQPLHFAFVGPKQRKALAGHLAPSQDASGRRFPFVTVGAFDVAQPAPFVALSPIALTRLWARLATSARLALTTDDLAEAQPQLAAGHVEVEPDAPGWQAALDAYIDGLTLAALEQQMPSVEAAGERFDARHGLLALGLLLQPVIAQGVAQLDKGLLLPLPTDANLRAAAAAWWLHLVTRFVARWDAELAVFFVMRGSRACMAVGFNGASPRMLRSLIDVAPDDALIDLSQAGWVEDVVRRQSDYGLRKLSGYLQDPQLSLRQATASFREVFLGE